MTNVLLISLKIRDQCISDQTLIRYLYLAIKKGLSLKILILILFLIKQAKVAAKPVPISFSHRERS